MFKKLADFSDVSADQHPGQPAHCDHAFDVWRVNGGYVLIPVTGEPQKHSTMAEAQAAAFAALAKPEAE